MGQPFCLRQCSLFPGRLALLEKLVLRIETGPYMLGILFYQPIPTFSDLTGKSYGHTAVKLRIFRIWMYHVSKLGIRRTNKVTALGLCLRFPLLNCNSMKNKKSFCLAAEPLKFQNCKNHCLYACVTFRSILNSFIAPVFLHFYRFPPI